MGAARQRGGARAPALSAPRGPDRGAQLGACSTGELNSRVTPSRSMQGARPASFPPIGRRRGSAAFRKIHLMDAARSYARVVGETEHVIMVFGGSLAQRVTATSLVTVAENLAAGQPISTPPLPAGRPPPVIGGTCSIRW